MRIFITGGTGYLGGELVRQALAAGHEVGASFRTNAPTTPGVAWAALDVGDPAVTTAALAAFGPEVVIHTAYVQRGPELMATTGEGAGHVARASRGLGARLVHISSDALFDGEIAGLYSEADPPSPITPYGEAKARAEALVAAADPGAAIVRTSLIYGAREPLDVHTRFVLRLADGESDEKLFTDELRCPVCVEDLAAAVLELAAGRHAGVINVAGPEVLSRHALGALLARRWGRDPGRLPAGLSAESGLRRPRNCGLDTSLARRMLNTRLRRVAEALEMEGVER